MKNEDNPEQRKVTLGEFATSTSAHGFARVAQSRHLVVKLFWMALIVTGFVVATIQIEMVISSFIRRDTVTKVSMVFNSTLIFPAVTICNYNRYMKSRLTTVDRAYLDSARIYLAALNSRNKKAFSHIDPTNLPDLSLERWYKPGYTLANFTRDKGWRLTPTNTRCVFRGVDCNFSTDFKHVYTEFGNCYTFNGDVDRSPQLVQDQAGIGNGLHLEINIQQEEYENRLYRGDVADAGILFHVHNQSEPQAVETNGRAVGPGLHALAGLNRHDYVALDPPYGICNKTAELQFYPVYTTSGCIVECKRRHILNACNCKLLEHPGSEPVCELRNQLTCVKPLIANLTQDFSSMCSCPIPCNDVVYETALSYSQVPSQSTKLEVSTLLGVNPSDAGKNLIILDVFFQNLNYQQSEQLPAVEWAALIGDIGGQFGLFMGFSLLTVAEFIEFAIISIVTFVAVSRSRNKVKENSTKIDVQECKTSKESITITHA